MPVITQITEQKRRANRRNVYLDGAFAFGVNLNVVARFRLRVGLELSPDQVAAIGAGETRQECFDKALDAISRRMHSRAELAKKLAKFEYGQTVVESVLDQLQQLNYIDDARFAHGKAQSAATHKHHGRRRAMMELRKAGVKGATADQALDDVYSQHDSQGSARKLAEKKLASLKKLEPQAAKRRLIGMLLRRGFDYGSIKPIVDEMLGK